MSQAVTIPVRSGPVASALDGPALQVQYPSASISALPRPVHCQFAVSARCIKLGRFRLHPPLGTHQRLELWRRQRWTEVKALILIAAERLQELELLGRFDTFRHHLQ